MSRRIPVPIQLGPRVDRVTDDALFPLSYSILQSVEAGTIPNTDAAHLDAPLEVVRNIYFTKKKRGYFTGDHGAFKDAVASRAVSNADDIPDDSEDDDLLVLDDSDSSNGGDNDDANIDPVLGGTPQFDVDGDPIIDAGPGEIFHFNAPSPASPPNVPPNLPRGISRYWDREEAWSNLSPADVAYSLGFTDVVFNGMRKSSNIAIGAASIVPGKPVLERLQFNRAKTGATYDSGHPVMNVEESRAREFIAATSEQRVIFAGCPQINRAADGRNYCCGALPRARLNESPATQRVHVDAAKHGKIECPRNGSVYSIMANLNLNRKVFDSDHDYLHFYLVRPITGDLHQYVTDGLRSSPHSMPLPRVGNHHMAELELGFLAPDSGLQMSLDQHRRKLLHLHPHTTLSESTRFEAERRGLVYHGIAGPPLPNVSQLYSFGDYRNTMIGTPSFFRCVLASLYEAVSVRPSVGPSVHWSVRWSVGPSVRDDRVEKCKNAHF